MTKVIPTKKKQAGKDTLIWRNRMRAQAQGKSAAGLPLLSIVIISKDEEKILPRLLDSINAQDYTGPFEVILADISTDKTPYIARQYGCIVVKGGLPSRGRNNGAKKAKGHTLLFLDADVVLPNNFLTKNMNEFRRRKLVVGAPLSIPLSRSRQDRWIYDIYNTVLKAIQLFYPNASGYCLFCDRATFQKVHGFDETVTMWEDAEFVKRASRHGRFRLLKSAPVFCDIRRLNKDGRAQTVMKFMFFATHRLLKGEIRDCPLDYDMQGVNVKKLRIALDAQGRHRK